MKSPFHKPRKRFGQHFLVDPGVVEQISHAIQARSGQHIVEIGPGLGVLTEPLLMQLGELDAIELDRDIIPKLQQRCRTIGELRVHNADALNFDFRQLALGGEKLRIVGNLPYNISTPLLFALIDTADIIEDMHFMLQKEVVARLAATPNQSAYGKLSVIVQYTCRVEALFDVPPQCFSPPPKVESAVIRLTPHEHPPVALHDVDSFRRVLNAAFAQRRKTLKNNLKALLNAEQLIALGIDPQRRAESLCLSEFAQLANALSDHSAV